MSKINPVQNLNLQTGKNEKMANFDNVSIETIMATGASEMHTGSRLAMRGLIWLGYAYHVGAVAGETKPAAMVQNLNDALKTVGMGKGARSTKSNQAKAIGEAFSVMFGKEIATPYATAPEFVQACFNTAQAAGADSLLRLVDLAKHGNANYTEDKKAAKAQAEAEEKARRAAEMADRMANATPLVSLDLDAPTAVVAVQTLNPASVSDEVKENTLIERLAAMSAADFDTLKAAVQDEALRRYQAEPMAKAG